MLRFTWDRKKEAENIRKHGIGFELASTVFDDPHVVFRRDVYPSEQREQAVGIVGDSLLVIVIHTEDYGGGDDSNIHIISAREVQPAERRIYRRGYA